MPYFADTETITVCVLMAILIFSKEMNVIIYIKKSEPSHVRAALVLGHLGLLTFVAMTMGVVALLLHTGMVHARYHHGTVINLEPHI